MAKKKGKSRRKLSSTLKDSISKLSASELRTLILFILTMIEAGRPARKSSKSKKKRKGKKSKSKRAKKKGGKRKAPEGAAEAMSLFRSGKAKTLKEAWETVKAK